MVDHILKKQHLERFVDRLLSQRKVFAPTKQGDDLLFASIASPEEMAWENRNTKRAPKEMFFPHSEVLFRFRGDEITEEELEQEDCVLLGVRPCDARSFDQLSLVFDREEYRDLYFVQRRDHTTVVSMACNRPCPTCFCTSVGGGPADEAGSDILMFDLGDRHLVGVITEKGRLLIQLVDDLLVEASPEDIQKRGQLVEEASARIRSQVPVDGLNERLDRMFDHPVWQEIHRKCLGCGVCTYLCPTCHCFDITDDGTEAQGKRVRTWDSCMFPLFTLHASGHNPRTSGKERMRQRIMHKFNYTVENWGDTFCVGCGRCIRNCPVDVDIREMIKTLQEADV